MEAPKGSGVGLFGLLSQEELNKMHEGTAPASTASSRSTAEEKTSSAGKEALNQLMHSPGKNIKSVAKTLTSSLSTIGKKVVGYATQLLKPNIRQATDRKLDESTSTKQDYQNYFSKEIRVLANDTQTPNSPTSQGSTWAARVAHAVISGDNKKAQTLLNERDRAPNPPRLNNEYGRGDAFIHNIRGYLKLAEASKATNATQTESPLSGKLAISDDDKKSPLALYENNPEIFKEMHQRANNGFKGELLDFTVAFVSFSKSGSLKEISKFIGYFPDANSSPGLLNLDNSQTVILTNSKTTVRQAVSDLKEINERAEKGESLDTDKARADELLEGLLHANMTAQDPVWPNILNLADEPRKAAIR